MANTSEIRNGLTINHNHDIYVVVEFQHVKPGKGAAFVRTKLKSVTTGRVLEQTFPSGHKIDIVRVERRKYQFLYIDEVGANFMNNENFDQISIQEDFIENAQFLMEGMEVEILFHSETEKPLTIELPATIVSTVTYTEPGMKGDTATNTLKPATITSGVEVRVPLFVNEGDRIRIDTRTGAYVERVKE